MVIPTGKRSETAVRGHQLILEENADARSPSQIVDSNPNITPTPSIYDIDWSPLHNTAGNARCLSATYPLTELGPAGASNGISHFRGTTGGWTTYLGWQSSELVSRVEARMRFTNLTSNTRSLNITLSANNNAFTSREHLNVNIIAASGSNAWEARINEIVSNTGNTRSSTALSNTSGEMFFDVEAEISLDRTTVYLTVRQYNNSGTLLADETISWNKGSSVDKGDWKNIAISGEDYYGVFDFVKFYKWGWV